MLGLSLGLSIGTRGIADAPTLPLTELETALYTAAGIFDLADIGGTPGGMNLMNRVGAAADLNFGVLT